MIAFSYQSGIKLSMAMVIVLISTMGNGKSPMQCIVINVIFISLKKVGKFGFIDVKLV